MHNKTFNRTITALLFLCLIFASTITVNFASAQPLEVTIKPDGSINPPAAPISKVGNVYTLTGNITGNLRVQKSDVILDGAGYAVKCGTGLAALTVEPTTPLFNDFINNVTIKNLIVTQDESKNQAWGIMTRQTNNSVIANNTVVNIRDGLGIVIGDFSSGNLIVGNTVNNISGFAGIWLWGSNNTFAGNKITQTNSAFYFAESYSNLVIGNHMENNRVGIHGWKSNAGPLGVFNTIYSNNFVNNTYGFLNEAVFIADTGVLLHPPLVFIWDNESVGNFWSDYNGTDLNNDGIGDTTYIVDDHYPLEDANDADHYPLMNQVDTNIFASYPLVSSNNPVPTPNPTVTPAPESSSSQTTGPSTSETGNVSPSQSPEIPEMIPLIAVVAFALTSVAVALTGKRRGHN